MELKKSMSKKENACILDVQAEGVFIEESKNRFICKVQVDGQEEQCYISSSCRLDNFINLKGRKVLLTAINSPTASSKYAVAATRYKRNYIMLNPLISNRLIYNSIHSRRFCYIGKRKNILREHIVNDYKADLFIFDEQCVIEIKSVITLDENAVFPTVYSERSLIQLCELEKLLHLGYKVVYIIVSLNPYVKQVSLNKQTVFYEKITSCISKGMLLKAYKCKLMDCSLVITKEIPIK